MSLIVFHEKIPIFLVSKGAYAKVTIFEDYSLYHYASLKCHSCDNALQDFLMLG